MDFLLLPRAASEKSYQGWMDVSGQLQSHFENPYSAMTTVVWASSQQSECIFQQSLSTEHSVLVGLVYPAASAEILVVRYYCLTGSETLEMDLATSSMQQRKSQRPH